MSSNILEKNKIKILGKITSSVSEILTDDALNFMKEIEAEFGHRRIELLNQRKQRQTDIDRVF